MNMALLKVARWISGWLAIILCLAFLVLSAAGVWGFWNHPVLILRLIVTDIFFTVVFMIIWGILDMQLLDN